MKNIIISLFLVFALTLISCKKERNQSVTVIKDCTGTYLRIDSKDYQVCNIEMTDSYDNRENVLASYKKIEKCASLEDKFVCTLFHENEGWIEVVKIEGE